MHFIQPSTKASFDLITLCKIKYQNLNRTSANIKTIQISQQKLKAKSKSLFCTRKEKLFVFHLTKVMEYL